ncbi:MAG: pyrroloquinoline-quinone synthase PqqC, partial [Proteobacteria bacterium]|nr:pyrroloquinoline-quinone synthase PqqC [Pseudomonadota bacterium]
MSQPMSADELERRLRAIGAERYHDRHPFHTLLHGGRLDKGQVQAWVLNRYYYQSRIPMKDAALISRVEDPALRREWRGRIVDHDGSGPGDGGIERWLVLAEGVGLDRAYVMSTAGVLAATRFAVDAYVRFVRERPLVEAVASSLTELFAPAIHRERIAGLLEHYDFANEKTMAYFNRRLEEAPKDVKFGLDYVRREARTPEQQQGVI